VRVLPIIAALVLLIPAPAASAGWIGPQLLGDASVDYILPLAPTLVSNGRGTSVALVRRKRALALWRGGDGGPFTLVRMIHPHGGTFISFGAAAVDDRGAGALGWLEGDGSHDPDPEDDFDEYCCMRVKGAVLRQRGGISPISRLSAAGADADSITAAMRAGRAVLAWSDRVGVRIALGTSLRGFGRARTLTTNARPLAVWLTAGGVPHVMVERSVGEEWEVRLEELWPAGGRVHGRVLTRTFDAGFGVHRVAVGRDGSIAFSARTTIGPPKLVVGYRRPGKRLHLHRLSLARRVSLQGMAVAVAPNNAGGMLALATEHGAVVLRRLGADGSLGVPRRVVLLRDRRAATQEDLALAINGHGRGVLAGAAFRFSDDDCVRVMAARFGPNHAEPPRQLLYDDTPGLVFSLASTIDRWGRARVAIAGDQVMSYRSG
jgi:hypothetical protein